MSVMEVLSKSLLRFHCSYYHIFPVLVDASSFSCSAQIRDFDPIFIRCPLLVLDDIIYHQFSLSVFFHYFSVFFCKIIFIRSSLIQSNGRLFVCFSLKAQFSSSSVKLGRINHYGAQGQICLFERQNSTIKPLFSTLVFIIH